MYKYSFFKLTLSQDLRPSNVVRCAFAFDFTMIFWYYFIVVFFFSPRVRITFARLIKVSKFQSECLGKCEWLRGLWDSLTKKVLFLSHKLFVYFGSKTNQINPMVVFTLCARTPLILGLSTTGKNVGHDLAYIPHRYLMTRLSLKVVYPTCDVMYRR
jgi:hypothetical protein